MAKKKSLLERYPDYNGENKITPDAETRKALTELAERHLRIRGKLSSKEIKDEAKRMLAECMYGWPKATPNIHLRMKQKIGMNSPIFKMEQAEKEVIRKTVNPSKKEITAIVGSDIALKASEREFIQDRLDYYTKEFDFNESSDREILNEVITDELILLRNRKLRLEMPVSKALNKADEDTVAIIQKRLISNLENLGLTRKQRLDADDNSTGNVASVGLDLDKKLAEIQKLEDNQFKTKLILELEHTYSASDVEELIQLSEELEFQRKSNMFDKNIISEAEEQDIIQRTEKLLGEANSE